MKGYKAKVTCMGFGITEDEAMNDLEFSLHEYSRSLAAGEEPMDIEIKECEIEDEGDLCDRCKKCGENTCGNDTTNYLCFEGD